jgi:hypothetical protein
MNMRILTAIVYIALTTLILSCDQHHDTPDIDPMLGRQCFENHRATLAPGTQYEGIAEVTEDRLTIRIMDGIDVTTLDCGLNPDRTLQITEK